jgi:AdoMet-dependent heme synthase
VVSPSITLEYAHLLSEAKSVRDPNVSRTSSRRDYDDQPLLVFWEMTRACDLTCLHCRANANAQPGGDELTYEEGRNLIDELAAMNKPLPILVMTGGDCLMRNDLMDLVTYAAEQSVPVAIAPTVTERLTDATLHAMRQHGVKTVSLSLDGATRRTHDGLRGVNGHFEDTLAAVASLQRCGFSVQVNTTVMASNVEELADVAVLMQHIGVDVWEVFFLIATDRGTHGVAASPQENEDVCNFLVDASRYGFTVRTVEAPFFRRIAAERRSHIDIESVASNTGALYGRLRDRLFSQLGSPLTPPRTTSSGTRDGKGIIFVAANGDVYPSGFLPLSLGNVKEEKLVDIYRDHPLLQTIRDAQFKGTCGTCTYNQLCGGSRARAYALSGDPLDADPGCLLVQSAQHALGSS